MEKFNVGSDRSRRKHVSWHVEVMSKGDAKSAKLMSHGRSKKAPMHAWSTSFGHFRDGLINDREDHVKLPSPAPHHANKGKNLKNRKRKVKKDEKTVEL